MYTEIEQQTLDLDWFFTEGKHIGFVGKDGYSENKIRKEHGLKLRASYESFKGRTR